MTFAEQIGQELAQAAANQGYDQREVAKLCGMNESRVSILFRGKGNPRAGTIDLVAHALGFSPCLLLMHHRLAEVDEPMRPKPRRPRKAKP